MLHKALYSGHNDHNYFEVAHTIKYVDGMVGNNLKLYTFVDNHDVERIYTKLKKKEHFLPVHVMLYTLPGIPSLYYGSEFGIEGRKERHSDDSLRPDLNYEDYKDAVKTNSCTKLIAALGKIRQNTPALCYGEYKELLLQTTHFAYARVLEGKSVITTVNNGDNEVSMNLPAGNSSEYVGALSGERVAVNGGRMQVKVAPNSGEIWIPEELYQDSFAPVKMVEIPKAAAVKIEEVETTFKPETVKVGATKTTKTEPVNVETVKTENVSEEVDKTAKAESIKVEVKAENKTETAKTKQAENVTNVKETIEDVAKPTEEVIPDMEETISEKVVVDWNKSYEDMSVEELQEAILEKMRKNGPVTDYMLGTVRDNTHHGSLVTWVKSFR